MRARRSALFCAAVFALAAPACGTLLAASEDGEPVVANGGDPLDGGATADGLGGDGSTVVVTDPTDASDGAITPDALLSKTAAYRAAVMSDGPIAYWRFSETPGTTTYASETGNHPATSGAGLKSTAINPVGLFGVGSQSLAFNGTTGVHAKASDLPFLPNAFTFEAWIHIVAALDGNFRHLVQHSTGSIAHGIYLLGNEGVVIERIAGGQKTFVKRPLAASALSAWHHVAATYDGSTVRLFFDGVEAEPVITFSSSPAPASVFMLGAKAENEPSLPAGTRIAEVAVYDKALTKERVSAHFDLGKP